MDKNENPEVDGTSQVSPSTEQVVTTAENLVTGVADSTNYDLSDEDLKEYIEAYEEVLQRHAAESESTNDVQASEIKANIDTITQAQMNMSDEEIAERLELNKEPAIESNESFKEDTQTLNDVLGQQIADQPVQSAPQISPEQQLEDELWEEWENMKWYQKMRYSNNWNTFLRESRRQANALTNTDEPTNQEEKPKTPFGEKVARFFVSISGEDYDTLATFGKNSVNKYVTIGFSTLMDPLLSWFLFAMATSLSNSNVLVCIAIGGLAALIVFLIELVVVRTTPIGQIYNIFNGKAKGGAVVFVLFALLLRGGIAYQLGAINAPRATVVMYQEGIIAFDKQQVAEKREAEVNTLRDRRDIRNQQAQKAVAELSKSEQNWVREMTEGGNGRPKGRGGVSGGLEDVKNEKAQRWREAEDARKIADAQEDAEHAELKKLQDESVSYDYTSLSKILDRMSAKFPEIGRDRNTIHWLCILIGMLAFLIKGMMKPGAYERWKELSEEEKIAEQEIHNVTSIEKLSEAKEREVIARKKLAISEQDLLLAEVSKEEVKEQRDKKKREDSVTHVEKNADRAIGLVNRIKDAQQRAYAQRKLEEQFANAAVNLLSNDLIKLPMSMPKTGVK